MIIVAKNNKEYIPLLIGSIESPEIGEFISCIEVGENPSRNMFGQLDIIKLHITDVKGFKGSYSFATQVDLQAK